MNPWIDDSWRTLKRMCLNNAVLKGLALVLAALTYYAIHDATSFEVVYDVPLEIEVERGMAVLDQDVRSVQVMLRGSQQDILMLDAKKIRAVVKRKASDPSGSEKVGIGPSHIDGVKGGVKVERVRPSEVVLTFDREGEKTVAVAKPQTVGKPLVGKVELEYEPRAVVLRGPERRLREKDVVFTEPVDIEGRIGSFTRRVRVIPPSEAWRPQIEPAEITVRVTIAADSMSRQLTNIPVLVMVTTGTEAVPALDPTEVTVTLQGRTELLDKLLPGAVRVFADLQSGGAQAGQEIPLQVHLPPEFDDVTATVQPVSAKKAAAAEATVPKVKD